MADRVAIATGNFSAPGTWTGGIVPGSGDRAQTAGFTVTIDVDIDLSPGGSLQATSTGYFDVTTARTIVADVELAGTGGAGSAGLRANHSSGTVTVTGNVTVNTASAGTAYGIRNNNTGTLVVNGNISGNSGAGSFMHGAANMVGGTLTVVGNVTASALGIGIVNSGGGTVGVTGNVAAGAGTSIHGISNVSTGTVNVTGDVTGGSASSAAGINNAAAGTVTVTGNVTGGSHSSGYGVNNAAVGTVTVTGNCTGGSVGPGGQQNAAGTMTVGNAVGNSYGPGGPHSSAVPGVSAGNTSGQVTRVKAIQYGPYGMSPTVGAVKLLPDAANQAIFIRSDTGATLTLTDPTATADWPDEADVRLGVEYDLGDKVGTCAVPAAGNVSLGIAVDDTTGTAVLTAAAAAAAVWDADRDDHTTAGTFGATGEWAGSVDPQDVRDAMLLAPSGGADPGSIDDLLDDLPTATENAAAVWADTIEGGETAREIMRYVLAFISGETEGATGGAATIQFKSRDGGTVRIEMEVDEFGNRTLVTLDAS